MAERDARGEMPFLDHLEELRWRILYSLLAIIVGTLVGWVVVEHVDIIGLLMRPVAPLLHDQKLVFTSPTEPFFITLKFAFAVGCLLASPVVVYHVWAFLAPALYVKERRVIMPAFSVGIVLFLAGASVAYLWVLPRALKVLFSFQSAALRAAARRYHPGLAGARHAAVPDAPPALRAGAVGRGRGAAHAARRRVDVVDVAAPHGLVRGEHLVRLGGDAPSRAS